MNGGISCPVQVRYVCDLARRLYGETGGPAYATPESAGLDLRVCTEEEEIVIPAGERRAVPSGIAVQPLLPGVAGFLYSRSGLGARQGVTIAQGVGVIDADYRGEIIIMLLNTSHEERRLRQGDRVAQLVFQPVCRVQVKIVDHLVETERGSGGFGHSGR